MLNDLVVADILANGTPNLYFDARRLNMPPHGSEIMSKTLLENSLKTLSQCT
jgi:hypothetical protein